MFYMIYEAAVCCQYHDMNNSLSTFPRVSMAFRLNSKQFHPCLNRIINKGLQYKQFMRLKNIFEVQCDIPAQLTLYWEILSASVKRYHITLLWHLNFLVVNIISLSKLSAHCWFPNLCNIQNLPVACKFYLLWSYILSLYKLLKKMTFKFEIIIWGFNCAVGSSNRISVMEH